MSDDEPKEGKPKFCQMALPSDEVKLVELYRDLKRAISEKDNDRIESAANMLHEFIDETDMGHGQDGKIGN